MNMPTLLPHGHSSPDACASCQRADAVAHHSHSKRANDVGCQEPTQAHDSSQAPKTPFTDCAVAQRAELSRPQGPTATRDPFHSLATLLANLAEEDAVTTRIAGRRVGARAVTARRKIQSSF